MMLGWRLSFFAAPSISTKDDLSQLISELFAHAAVDDKVDGRVDDQEEMRGAQHDIEHHRNMKSGI